MIIERTYNQRKRSSARLKHISALLVRTAIVWLSTPPPRYHGTLRRQVARLVGMKQHKVHVIKE